MKNKIIGAVVDVLLIALAFFITDTVMFKVLCTEDMWIELGIYILSYAALFGIKWGIVTLWKRRGC